MDSEPISQFSNVISSKEDSDELNVDGEEDDDDDEEEEKLALVRSSHLQDEATDSDAAKFKESGSDEEEVDKLPSHKSSSHMKKLSFSSDEFSYQESPEQIELRNKYCPIYVPDADKFASLPDKFDESQFPSSYTTNTSSEKRLIAYCQAFRSQYAALFPDRSRLLLTPVNEFNIPKFVCTTLKPTWLPFPELYDWSGAALFVSDFLKLVPLRPSTELPNRLISPAMTLDLQKGTSFDYATLLCSLLLGVGYDAYVVSGYATRECCYIDQSRTRCPDLILPPRVSEVEIDSEPKKYTLRPPKQLTSRFAKIQTAKQLIDDKVAVKENDKKLFAEEEADFVAPEDPLNGLRVHAWVLVLSGNRDVDSSFFIEPVTGIRYPLPSTNIFLGIESVWNAENYWANMQDCSNGIDEMTYDLGNSNNWEYVLPRGGVSFRPARKSSMLKNPVAGVKTTPSREPDSILRAGLQSTIDFDLDEFDSEFSNEETPNSDHGSNPHDQYESLLHSTSKMTVNFVRRLAQFKISRMLSSSSQESGPSGRTRATLEDKMLLITLPAPWTKSIELSRDRYELRFPGGSKSVLYRWSKVDRFAPYSRPDGLVKRLTKYVDRERAKIEWVQETYQHRKDKLISRFYDHLKAWVTDKFDPGRDTIHLAELGRSMYEDYHRHKLVMYFYHNLRIDGLKCREKTPDYMYEDYLGRSDLMLRREVKFGGRVKKFGPIQPGTLSMCTHSESTLDKIVERFKRNPHIVNADEDVAERQFNLGEDRIFLVYHVGEHRIVACTREFVKPTPSDDRRNVIQLHCDTHKTFQLDIQAKPKTQVEIYNMLVELIGQEEVVKGYVRQSEIETLELLNTRAAEERSIELEISNFDTLRNKPAHELRLQLEAAAEEERTRSREAELDFLAPYLAQLDPEMEQLELASNIAELDDPSPSPTSVVHPTGDKITEAIEQSLNREQVFALQEECLLDCKQRLINKANIVQSRLEREVDELQANQQWFQLNQVHLSKKEEEDYFQSVSSATTRIRILEKLLAKHKQRAPHRYLALESKLRKDSRLTNALHHAI